MSHREFHIRVMEVLLWVSAGLFSAAILILFLRYAT